MLEKLEVLLAIILAAVIDQVLGAAIAAVISCPVLGVFRIWGSAVEYKQVFACLWGVFLGATLITTLYKFVKNSHVYEV